MLMNSIFNIANFNLIQQDHGEKGGAETTWSMPWPGHGKELHLFCVNSTFPVVDNDVM